MLPASLLQTLQSHRQEHLLRFWDELAPTEQQSLARQVQAIDFAQLANLFAQGVGSTDYAELADRALSPPAFRLDGRGNRFTIAEARAAGERALAEGAVGAVLVAGGQGTRLGFEHPKGMYPIGPISQATLFQILFEKLLAVSRRHEVRIPLYLMTSPATHDETNEYLRETSRFGLHVDDVVTFCQGTMPAVDAESGGVLLEDKGKMFAGPDGHGGMLAALDKSGTLADMRQRGLKHLFYFQVDNPLVDVCDPVFLGYHILSQSELSTQVVAKRRAEERVGNVVSIDGQLQIIEYSDLPSSAAQRVADDGSLALWAGNCAVHVFDVPFLERCAGDQQSLPFHIARKAVPYVDEQGELVTPTEPNAIKFERFIFDLLPLANNAIVVEIDGRRAFAPVKNAPGSATDAPEHAQAQLLSLHREWLEAAGAMVEDVAVEISPLFANGAEETAARVARGQRFTRDTYLCPSPVLA